MKRIIILTILTAFIMGCTLAKVEVNVVSERTSLENQVLGSYNSLTDDVLLVASVRGVDPLGNIESPPRRSMQYQEAMDAVQTVAFHEDDIEVFKLLKWAGENRDGFLSPFPIGETDVPKDLKEFAAQYSREEFENILREVNSARKIVMRQVIDTNENFSNEDLPKIQGVFGRINIENALPGERVQKEDGTWTIKE